MAKGEETMTHTPGPWSVGTGSKAYCVCSDLPDTDPSSIVAENIERYDDARLIAAAPDLLEELEETASVAHRMGCPDGEYGLLERCTQPLCIRAYAAIKAAKGEAPDA